MFYLRVVQAFTGDFGIQIMVVLTITPMFLTLSLLREFENLAVKVLDEYFGIQIMVVLTTTRMFLTLSLLREFENLAVKVLDECYFTDQEKAAMLIERKYASWGGMTCLEMASSAQDQVASLLTYFTFCLNQFWHKNVVRYLEPQFVTEKNCSSSIIQFFFFKNSYFFLVIAYDNDNIILSK